MFVEFIKSPLNYTGNKFRILQQLYPYFPSNINVMVDLFCGGATVGINTECKKRIFIDRDERVIGLLKHLSTIKFEKLYDELCELIKKYHLSNSYEKGFLYYKNRTNDDNTNNGLKKYNEKGFYKLRDDYNNLSNMNTKKAYTMLYLLLLYAFNNDLRFSKDGKFNLPVGKTDLNKANIIKVEKFIDRCSLIEKEYICGDFRDEKIDKIIKKADFVYLDPPYLITNAVYNESGKWTEKEEKDLISLLEYLNKHGKNFMLSNVVEKKGATNVPLSSFINTNKKNIVSLDIDYHYRSASYNKKNRNSKEHEIIVMPKRLYAGNQ